VVTLGRKRVRARALGTRSILELKVLLLAMLPQMIVEILGTKDSVGDSIAGKACQSVCSREQVTSAVGRLEHRRLALHGRCVEGKVSPGSLPLALSAAPDMRASEAGTTLLS